MRHTPLKISNMYHHNTALSPSFSQSNPLCTRSQALLVSQECVAWKSGRLAIPGVHHVERAGAEKHTRSCANGPHRQTTPKGPLHRCEMDKGSQQVQAAQSFNQRTSQAMIAPCENGCSSKPLFIGGPTAAVMAMCELGASTESRPHFRQNENRHRARLPLSLFTLERSASALSKPSGSIRGDTCGRTHHVDAQPCRLFVCWTIWFDQR